MKSRLSILLMIAAGLVASVGCASLRLHEIEERDYSVEVSKQDDSQFELKVSLVTPQHVSERMDAQLLSAWSSEATKLCGKKFQGEPLVYWQFKRVPGTRNSVKPFGDFSVKLGGASGLVVCGNAG